MIAFPNRNESGYVSTTVQHQGDIRWRFGSCVDSQVAKLAASQFV
jgi:hypothetical protein